MSVDVHRTSALPYRLIHRSIRPFSVTIVLYLAAIAWQYLGYNKWPEGPWADFAGWCALGAAMLLVVGWVRDDDRVHDLGLALSAAVFFGRMTMYVTEQGWDCPGAWFSFAMGAGAFLAWAAERFYRVWQHGGVE